MRPGPSAEYSVAVVVLSAGASRRFDAPHPKQLLPVEGEPMVRRALRTALAAELGPVFLVVGHRADEVAAAVGDLLIGGTSNGSSGSDGPRAQRVDNPRWQEGQSTSVAVAIETLASHPARPAAALFVPCDQPALGPQLLTDLVHAWADGRGTIVVPVAEGRRGSPVLFDRRHFAALRHLEGDQGGRQILAEHRGEITEVSTEPRQLMDIDTLADLERWQTLESSPPRAIR